MNVAKTRNMNWPRRWITMVLAAGLVLLVAGGCAYFNKLYNAKKKYNEAKAVPLPADGSMSRSQIQMYDDVIEKCRELLEMYPGSRWVDDAVLLIGKSYYEKGEYSNAIQTLEALAADFPESDLNQPAREYLARSYIGNDEPERALGILKPFLEEYPDSKHTPVILYLLGTTSLQLDQETEAMEYLDRLGRDYPKSPYTLDADMEIGEIFLAKEQYEKSLAIYERLNNSRLDTESRARCLIRLSRVYVRLGRHDAALETFKTLYARPELMADSPEKAQAQLLRAEALVGLDSLERAIDLYKYIGTSFPRSMFSAESYYHLGVLHQEKMDSLSLAQTFFEKVPQEYPASPFSTEAVKRSSSISQLLRLQNSLGEASEEGRALTQFSLAEVQLFQFNNFKEALNRYIAVLDSFPNSDIAPKAAYAIGYIYQNFMSDSLKAREAYLALVKQFPDSHQARQARLNLGMDETAPAEETETGDEPDEQ